MGKYTKFVITIILISLLLYTRFAGLNWGLPYPMHPDERNMAVALQQLNCREFPIFNFQFPINFSNLKFQISNCYNPHFFAYGQLPLYLAFFLIRLYHFLDGGFRQINFEEATIALRSISATASILNVFVLMKIIDLFFPLPYIKNKIEKIMLRQAQHYPEQSRRIKTTDQKFKKNGTFLFFICRFSFLFLIFTFSPYAIQFSHFGTTESLLMLFYSSLVLLSLLCLDGRISNFKFLILNSFVAGLALATKVSSLVFLTVPVLTITLKLLMERKRKDNKIHTAFLLFKLLFVFFIFSFLFFILLSPHTFISWPDFISSFNYESAVALGNVKMFYTRQFENTIPVVFHMVKIFPYALGWPQFLLTLAGFFFLPWRNKGKVWKRYVNGYNLLRFAFFVYFLPNAFVYAKWTRFMAPIFPIMSVFAVLYVCQLSNWIANKLKIQNLKSKVTINSRQILIFVNYSLRFLIFTFGLLICTVPGIAYLSIYTRPDVRFTASEWIYGNIPSGSTILSETANVVDIPIPSPYGQLTIDNYQLANISFDFYNLNTDYRLKYDLDESLAAADYIFAPSRRIYFNHTCLWPVKNSKIKIQNYNSTVKKSGNAAMQQLNNNLSYSSKRCSYLKAVYPELNRYYTDLFSGNLGFKPIAEFSSFPQVCMFNIGCWKFNDEQSEETWTVFDHPVIRIYKRV